MQTGGGIYYRGDSLFVNKIFSKMRFLTKGSYSLIFQSDVSEMPFISTNLKTFGKNPREVLVKIGVLHTQINVEFSVYAPNTKQFAHKIFSQSEKTFENEVFCQNDCYKLSNQYLQQLCPNIVYSGFYPTKEFIKNSGLNITQTGSSSAVPPYLSVIIMEMIDDSVSMQNYTLKNYDKSPEEIKKCVLFQNMARYSVLELAMTTGYIHRDLGLPNLLIAPNYTGYFVGDVDSTSIVGRPIIIDFSSAIKIRGLAEEISTILQSGSETRFTDALIAIGKQEKLHNAVSAMSMRYDNWEYFGPGGMSGYGWIFNPNFFRTEDKNDTLEMKIKKTNDLLANLHAQKIRANAQTTLKYEVDGKEINVDFPVTDEEALVKQLFPSNDLQIYRTDNAAYRRETDKTDFDVVSIDDVNDLFRDYWTNAGGRTRKKYRKRKNKRARKSRRQRK